MSRIAYVNGSYVTHRHAYVHVEDRGFQFADGVYEVWAVRNKKLLDADGHFQRLERSLRALNMPMPVSMAVLRLVLNEITRQNHVKNGIVYLQITRGVAPRDHVWDPAILPTLVITAKSINPVTSEERAGHGISVITMPDLRWKRCDIKSISLLPNILARQAARGKGAYEAWLVDVQGMVTEGAASNAWIVTPDNVLVTRNLSNQILAGITRAHLKEIASSMRLVVEERPFSVAEALQAREAFITAASAFVMPVIKIDEALIGDGNPGPVASQLRKVYANS